MSMGAPAIITTPLSERDRLLQYASKSIVNFGLAFLEKDFRPKTTSPFMYEMASEMGRRGKGVKPLVNMIPRGHVKTTLTRAMILQDFLMAELMGWGYIPESSFYIWVAESEGQSELNLLSVKDALENNELIRYYFGDQVNRKKWSSDTIQLRNGSVLMIKSNTSGIRGLNYLGRRPDIIIADDIESENNTKTPEARDRNARLVTATLIPATNAETGLVIINNTPVHHDCFVMRVTDGYNRAGREGRDYPWRVFFRRTSIEAPLWPEYMGKAALTRKKAQLEEAGQIASWYMEYEMSVDDRSSKMLSEDDIRDYDANLVLREGKPWLNISEIDGEARSELVPVRLFGGIDMASSMDTGKNDFTAIVITAVDHLEREFVIWEYHGRGVPVQTLPSRPDRPGIADMIYETERRVPMEMWINEDTAVSHGLFDAVDILYEQLKERGDERPRPYMVGYKPGTTDKLTRIYNAFSGKAARRRLFVPRRMAELRRQWYEFGPKMTNDDIIDAHHLSSIHASPPPAPILQGVTPTGIVQEDYLNRRRTAGQTNNDNWKTA